MENMDKKGCEMCGHNCAGGSCSCGMHGGHGCHGGKFRVVRLILKLILIALIFMFGFSLGQMTGFIKAGYGEGYGRGMMRGNGYYFSQTVPQDVVPTPQ
jgi:hypothetical protein